MSDYAYGQLRHLYKLMLDGHVKDTAEAARGLLGPSIEWVEGLMAERDRLATDLDFQGSGFVGLEAKVAALESQVAGLRGALLAAREALDGAQHQLPMSLHSVKCEIDDDICAIDAALATPKEPSR